MKAQSIDVVLFDLGGVLVELAGVSRMLEWSPSLTTTDELWRRWLHSDAVRRFETGGIERDEFAAAIVAEFGCPVEPADFLAEFTWWPRSVLPGAFELLAAMRQRYRIASVSNTNAIHWERFSSVWALDAAFHHNFPSHRVGKLKPDDDYFQHVLDELGAQAQRVLFVDDNAINVEAAARMGMMARRVAGPAEVRAVLAELALHPEDPR